MKIGIDYIVSIELLKEKRNRDFSYTPKSFKVKKNIIWKEFKIEDKLIDIPEKWSIFIYGDFLDYSLDEMNHKFINNKPSSDYINIPYTHIIAGDSSPFKWSEDKRFVNFKPRIMINLKEKSLVKNHVSVTTIHLPFDMYEDAQKFYDNINEQYVKRNKFIEV